MLQEASSVFKDPSMLRRLTFAANAVHKDTPRFWDIVTSFGFKYSSEKGQGDCSDKVKLLLENTHFLDEKAFDTDSTLLKELSDQEGFQGHTLGIVLISTKQTCDICKGHLLVRDDRPSFPVIYSNNLGTVNGTHFRKYCGNHWKGCSFTQHYGFHQIGNEGIIKYDEDCLDLPFFLSSHMTAFETKLLRTLSGEVLLGQLSYKQKSEIYNFTHGYDVAIKSGPKSCEMSSRESDTCDYADRRFMDRRRLEEGHIRFCVLDVFKRYPLAFPHGVISTSIQKTLDNVTPIYYQAFSDKYAGHNCSYPGCRCVLVIDGNMKNRRDVCAAIEAGFTEYVGLPGAIKTGCKQTPAFQSKFCYEHSLRVGKKTCPEDEQQLDGREGVVGIITGKKQTRSGTYYQVAWLSHKQQLTWEPASALPQSLIDEFESSSCNQKVITTSDACYGGIDQMLVVEKRDPSHPPQAKSLKSTLPTSQSSIFTDNVSMELQCNTEKDKGRLHHRTAGILAGIRPCGIIVLLSELFISESKTQVYANLHQFLQNYPQVAKNMEYICYDDGCHLRKFARHSSRRDITPTAQKLASVEIVIDKLHMAGHIDKWCQTNCDPHLFQDLDNVNTEICEQTFSWLSRYGKMTRKMNRSRFFFFLLYMCDLHNEREERKLDRGCYIVH